MSDQKPDWTLVEAAYLDFQVRFNLNRPKQ